MPLISDSDQQYLKDLFQKELQDPVSITYFTQHDSPLTVPGHECEYCQETRELWETLAGLSDKISLEVHDLVRDAELAKTHGVDKIPASILSGHSQGKLRFFGIPSGYEFATLVEDIMDLSKGITRLSPATREVLKTISQDIHMQVFVTPT